jgi:hypothetical protein
MWRGTLIQPVLKTSGNVVAVNNKLAEEGLAVHGSVPP